MAFMQAMIHPHRDLFLISDQLDETIYCRYNSINLPVGDYDVDELPEDEDLAESILAVSKELKIDRWEIVDRFHGELSAPGYMDRTDFVLGESIAEVAQQLLNMYYDGEEEYMDADQKVERTWLEALAEGKGGDEALTIATARRIELEDAE